MILLFAKEFRIQASIVEQLALNGNADYIDLYEKMILGIKLISDAKSDIDLAKILRWHEGADKKGYLRKPNDNCLSIDLDAEHRLDVYRINDKAVVISSVSHHGINIGILFDKFDFLVDRIKHSNNSDLEQLYLQNIDFGKKLFSLMENVNSATFKTDIDKNLCPFNPLSYMHNLKKRIKTLVEDNRYYGQETTDEDKSNAMRSFIDENHAFLERTIVNARCFNNVASVVCGNGDLKETALLKLELQEDLLKNIADVFAFVDDSSLSWNDKGEIFGGLKSTVLNAFNDSHDRIIYGTNESSPEYVLAKAIDKSFQNKINNDSNLQSKNNRISKESLFEFENKDISDKKIKVKGSSPEIFFVFAKNLWNNFLPSKLWNTFFPSKKKKAQKSAIPENKIVKEENITKTETDKNVKEAQESTWAKSGQQKQGDSFDFETSKTINETMDYLRKELREVEERLKDTDCTAEEKQRLEAHKQGLRETYETFESANKKLSSLRTTKSKNKRAEASKEVEVNEETQEEDPAVARRNVMEENEKKNNTLGNVNSSGKKSRRSL